MRQPSLQTKLLDYLKLRYPAWIDHWTIEEFGKGWGYLGDTCRRRAEDLVELGLVEKDKKKSENGREYLIYRYLAPKNYEAQKDLAKVQGRLKLERVWSDIHGSYIMKEVIAPI